MQFSRHGASMQRRRIEIERVRTRKENREYACWQPVRRRARARCRRRESSAGNRLDATRTDALLSQLETGKIACVHRPCCGRLTPGAAFGEPASPRSVPAIMARAAAADVREVRARPASPRPPHGLGEVEQIKVLGRDHALLDQRLEIDDPAPISAVEQHDRNRRRPCRSGDSVSSLEQFVHRAEAAGENHQRVGAHGQMHLAHGEVVELEASGRA